MDYRSLHMKTVADLRQIAKEIELKIPARTSKAVLVEMILEHQAANAVEQAKTAPAAEPPVEAVQEAPAAEQPRPKQSKPAAEQPRQKQSKPASKAAKPREDKPARGRRSAAADEAAKVAQPEASPKAEEAAEVAVQDAAPMEAALPAVVEAQPKQEGGEVKPAAEEADPRTPAPVQEGRTSYARPMSTQQRMGARTQSGPANYRPNQRQMGQAGRPGYRYEGANPRTQRSYDAPQTGYRRQNGFPDESKPRYRKPMAGQEAGNPAGRYSQGTESGQIVPAQPPVRQEDATQEIRAAARPAAPATVQAPAANELNPAVPELLSSGECGDGAGILEIHPEGYGFLRVDNYLPGNRDVYVSAAQIRRFNLRTGDYVVGKTRAQQMGDRSVGLIYISEVNGQTPDMARHRRPFDSLVPVYPDERLRLERPESKDISLRLIDMIAPIGKGQRGMIVSQPKAGKTTLLKKIANAITANNPDVHLIVLLIDERPEEVTDMKRSIQGEVVYSTFDEAPENHTRVSEMVLERAQRLVELGKDVVVLLDSITRLARAYNLVIPPTGRSLSGGLDPGALFKPKRFFGAARNIENGGSLTIIATALVDTGSRMDDIIFEEFKGTGNMELHLDRSLSDRRIFPAIDLYRSGTRREELLMDREELDGVYQVRRMLSKGSPQEAAEQLISLMEKTATNREFFQKFKGWMSACEKDGFTMR